jgi:hypothetical protein
MALMTFARFPEIQFIKAGLLFVMHKVFVDEQYHREEQDDLWDVFALDIARLEVSYKNDLWTPNPTPLCGWCPVTTCEHFGQRGRRK